MALLDRFGPVMAARARLDDLGVDPFGVRMERVLSPTEAIVRGRPTLLAGTNNYLGLTFDEDCIAAARTALEQLGTGTTGSSIANGSYAGHKGLEAALARFFGREHGMVFSTGYQANLGIISTIAGPNDYLLIDADCHASIYDACRMGSATIIRFRHNDAADLDRRLRKLADQPGNKIIITEGIYSMLGDTAPLAAFAEVKRRHGAYLVVDEAHSLGVLGAHGRGLAEVAGVEDDVDFVVGTFSKSLGAVGGFCVSNHPQFEILRVVCRPYMFTASLPPAVIASVRKALEIVETRPQLRVRLQTLSTLFYDRLERRGFQLGPEKSPVVAVHLPDVELATAMWKALLDEGVYVNLALPPATPNNTPLLRCSICAAHTPEQLETIADVLTEVAYRLGLFQEEPALLAAAS